MSDSVKVSDVIAQFLKEKEIKHIFGIIGSANAHIFDSIQQLGYTEIVCCHHEQSATMAMQTYFRMSGKLTAALVTAGGGSSNAITGVMSAWADSIPGIIISGQENARFINAMHEMRMWGIQGYDSTDMVKNITKYTSRIFDPETTQYELEKGYQESQSGRFGPVWIDFPMDVQGAVVERNKLKEFNPKPKQEATNHQDSLEASIAEVMSLIQSAERPVFWLGHGVRLAGGQSLIEKLLQTFKFPTLVSWAGLDMLDDSHPLNYGRAGVYGNRSANLVVQNSDLVIAIGNRMAIPMIGYVHEEFAREGKVVQVDIDPLELEKTNDISDLAICADAGDFISTLISEAEKQQSLPEVTLWKRICDGYKKRYPYIGPEHDDTNGFMNSYRFVDRLIEHFKDDQIVTTDMGTALLSGHQVMRMRPPQRLMTSTGLGEMGYGLPAAIGASFASNKGEVMALNCDGGIMMNLQELQTIVHHQLPIKIFIFNNDGYLMIKHTQKNLFKGRYSAVSPETGVSCPDFEKIAYGFGIEYFSITTWDDFDAVVPIVQYSNKPAIINVFMDPEQYFLPKLSLAMNPDGSIVSPPLEDISPLLDRDSLESEMVIPVHAKSRSIKL